MRALALGALLLASVVPARGDDRPDDPARSRYLFAPSGFLLRGGEVTLSQTELVLTSLGVGIGDHLTVVAGSAMPALYAMTGGSRPNLQLEVRAGFSPSDIVHLAVGFQSLTVPTLSGGYGYAVASIGTERLHVTVGAGLPYIATVSGPGTGPPLLFGAASVRLGRHVALATEHWLFPTELGRYPMVNAGLVRLLVWRFAIGVGGARISDVKMPLPWLDLAVHLGR